MNENQVFVKELKAYANSLNEGDNITVTCDLINAMKGSLYHIAELQSKKVFVIKFDWSTHDSDGVDLFIYRHYGDAYDKFKELICAERNPENSWVGRIEFDDEGYPVDDHYEFDFEDNNSGESEVYWHITDKDDYYTHSRIDLLVIEVL